MEPPAVHPTVAMVVVPRKLTEVLLPQLLLILLLLLLLHPPGPAVVAPSPADVGEVGVRVGLGGQGLLAAAPRRQELPLFGVPPLHPAVLEPDLHLHTEGGGPGEWGFSRSEKGLSYVYIYIYKYI